MPFEQIPSPILRQTIRWLNPARFTILAFAGIILAGTFALMLPVSNAGKPIGFIDALFMATSATCVTGLAVVDPGTTFTGFGEAVLLVLVQVGGFGIMTLSTLILFVLGRRASFTIKSATSGSFLKLRRYPLRDLLLLAMGSTLAFELVGTVLLLIGWWGDGPPGEVLWHAVFHSVSAFCNAGFSLFQDNLIRHAGDVWTNAVIMTLIVFGGIGFFVIVDLYDTLRRHPDPAKRRLSFHSKIVLSMTALLIVGGTVGIYLIERGESLAEYSSSDALLRAMFQSVTARTAGFNSIDLGTMTTAGLFLVVALMFIGAAPGSMAGGVKVTTVGAFLIVVLARLRGRNWPGMFGRSVKRENLERSVVVILVSSVFVGLVTFLLQLTEFSGATLIESRGKFIDLLFETVSAFATVGLSTGVTPELTPVGRLVISLAMFVGRLGPLTLVYAMERQARETTFRYPDEEIMIG